VKGPGADQPDYTRKVEDAVRDVDVVFHTIGADFRPRSWKVVKKGGWLVGITGQFPDERAAFARGGFIGVRWTASSCTDRRPSTRARCAWR
jgi:NADPH:quinone reductase-like Zn-dependent oxidoreductase